MHSLNVINKTTFLFAFVQIKKLNCCLILLVVLYAHFNCQTAQSLPQNFKE